jgi:hypothetical protein
MCAGARLRPGTGVLQLLAEGGFVRFILVSLLAFCALASAAAAARVQVRVEGKSTTIYGASEPTLEAGATALDALEAASLAGEFYYHVTQFSFGPFVDQIGRFASTPADGWVYKVNGVSPDVGAAQYTLKDRDRVLWYWTPFSGPAATPTLRLERLRGVCYRVTSEDAKGTRRAAAGAALVVDGRRVRTRAGRACVGPHRSLVRAVRPGAVRSNAVP